MREYKEEDYLLISGIQHFVFCERQWALIHIEGLWSENYLTATGRIMHERAHNEKLAERRGDTIILRSLKVYSSKLGVTGECDVVEFHKNEEGVPLKNYEGTFLPFPVEYKRGRPKIEESDRLQLLAQAVCLEEMLCCEIKEGAIFYGEPKKRERVQFSAELREQLDEIIARMHSAFERQVTKKAVPNKKCSSCSLKEVCVPKLVKKGEMSVERYLEEGLL